MKSVIWGVALGVAVLVLLVIAAGCTFEDDSQPADQPGIEVDVDAPKAKKPKAPAPKPAAPKAKPGSKR